MSLTVGEIAATLAYSKSYVLNLIKAGELKAMPRSSPRGKYLIDEAEFARYQETLASKDTTGREFAYVLLNRYVGQLPDTFDRYRVDESIGNLASELNRIGHTLRNLQHPYQYWSGMLDEIASCIEILRQSDLFKAILVTDSMKLLPLLERDLRGCIQKLREDLTGKQDPELTRDILFFRDTMLDWSKFCESWINFRDTGAKCFTSLRSDEKYGELKHSGSVVVSDTRLHRELIWNAFGLVYQPTVVTSMANWLARVTELLGWQFDTICSLSAAALQMSSFIAWRLRKNVVALDNQTFEFQPPEPPGASYVFVDTVCQTGSHLLESISRAKQHHKNVAGAIFITINDMMPEDSKRKRFQIIDDMKNEERLIYCYDISYLYENLSPAYMMAVGSVDTPNSD
ncbi:MAG: helix-turn-helix domain-containing protein [Dehalococcoidales bacterium]